MIKFNDMSEERDNYLFENVINMYDYYYFLILAMSLIIWLNFLVLKILQSSMNKLNDKIKVFESDLSKS